jgi:hypothetical protein
MGTARVGDCIYGGPWFVHLLLFGMEQHIELDINTVNFAESSPQSSRHISTVELMCKEPQQKKKRQVNDVELVPCQASLPRLRMPPPSSPATPRQLPSPHLGTKSRFDALTCAHLSGERTQGADPVPSISARLFIQWGRRPGTSVRTHADPQSRHPTPGCRMLDSGTNRSNIPCCLAATVSSRACR